MRQYQKLYDCLLDTLTMASTPLQTISDEDLKDCLAELEGDFYTFFYLENLNKLKSGNFLNANQVKHISSLREKIMSIPSSLWRANHFKSHEQWREVKCLADSVLHSLKLSILRCQ